MTTPKIRLTVLHSDERRLGMFRQIYAQTPTVEWRYSTDAESAATSFSRRPPDAVVILGPIGPVHEDFIKALSIRMQLDRLNLLFVLSGEERVPAWRVSARSHVVLREPTTTNELFQSLFTLIHRERVEGSQVRRNRVQVECGRLELKPLEKLVTEYANGQRQHLLLIRGQHGFGKVVMRGGGVRHAEYAGIQGQPALDMLRMMPDGEFVVQVDDATVYPHTTHWTPGAVRASQPPASSTEYRIQRSAA